MLPGCAFSSFCSSIDPTESEVLRGPSEKAGAIGRLDESAVSRGESEMLAKSVVPTGVVR